MLNLLGTLLFFITAPFADSFAASLNDPDAIPHVGQRARENYVSYLYANEHKAFAIGPGGAWAWRESMASAEEAERAAIEYCQRYTQQKCVPYAVNDRLVFDQQRWPTLWGPYKSKTEAAKAETGKFVGQRFYKLAFKDSNGKSYKLSDFRNKVVFLHFWGSWCPSCMIEFPSIKRLQQRINAELGKQVALVILQAREPFSQSQAWAKKNGFAQMKLYDSGVKSKDDTELRLADGARIPDRRIASSFPTTYVLDKNGLVIFSHRGPVHNWMEYIEFFKDVAQQSLK